MDLLFAAEQYAAAQATAVAAAQYYANAANAAMNAAAGGGNPRMMLAPGQMIQPGMMMGQMTLPPSQTWSSGSSAPPPPSMSRSSEHDDRDERDYERRRRRERSRERGKGRSRSRSRSRERSRKRRESMNWRERADEDNRSWRERADEDNKRSRDRSRDRSPGRYRERSPGEEDWRHATPNNTVMIRGLPQNITEQHVQDNITSHSLAARDIPGLGSCSEVALSRWKLMDLDPLGEEAWSILWLDTWGQVIVASLPPVNGGGHLPPGGQLEAVNGADDLSKFLPVVAGYRMDSFNFLSGPITNTALQVRGMPALSLATGSNMEYFMAISLDGSAMMG